MDRHSELKLSELSELTGVSIRNIRYYIQQEIVDRPVGEKRAAHYTSTHLEQLLQIVKWQKAGLSLDRIRQLIHERSTELPPAPKTPGTISVLTQIHLKKGIQLTIDPNEANMNNSEIRALAKEIITLLETTQEPSQGA